MIPRLLILALALFCALPARAQNAPAPPVAAPIASRPVAPAAAQQSLEQLLDAIQNDDYAAFLMPFDERFRPALSKATFENVVQTVKPRLATGCKTTYLDQLKRQSVTTYLWKLEFGEGDDLLAELSIQDDKIAGFFLR